MSEVERYLQQLGAALHARGRARRRLLAECREHLVDAGASHSEREAVRRFGSATDLAESFDTEIASRRAARATLGGIVGVLAVGTSTLAVVHAADPTATAIIAWAVVFFGAAQAAAVCGFLAALQALAMRHRPATPADVVLLCRRNTSALAFSLTALFAAGAAVPGQASAWAVLGGPVVAVLAAVWVVRVRALARRLEARPHVPVRSPLADLLAVARQPVRAHRADELSPLTALLVPGVAVATVAAFWWGRLDHGTVGSSLAAAAIEAALTVAGFLVLGPVLGLRSARTVSARPRRHGG